MNIRTQPNCWIFRVSLVFLTAFASQVMADMKDFEPSKDNTLIESPVTNSNGAGDGIYVGRTDVNGLRRGVIAFNLTNIPPGSTINTVSLTLEMSMTTSETHPITLHRLNASWGEAGSFGGGGGGPAQTGDATWNFRFFNTVSWSAAGGDFVATPSAGRPVGGVGPYTWESPGMVADVQGWVDDSTSNSGWLLKGVENTNFRTSKKFYSKEGLVPPKLVVDFTPSATGIPLGPSTNRIHFAPPWPVPARGSVNLSYTLPHAAAVSLSIVDVMGRPVRRLSAIAERSAGRHTLIWDGRTDSGETVSAGLYLANLVVHGKAYSRRVVLVK